MYQKYSRQEHHLQIVSILYQGGAATSVLSGFVRSKVLVHSVLERKNYPTILRHN